MEVENVFEENDLPLDRGICAFMSTLKRVSQPCHLQQKEGHGD